MSLKRCQRCFRALLVGDFDYCLPCDEDLADLHDQRTRHNPLIRRLIGELRKAREDRNTGIAAYKILRSLLAEGGK